MENNSLPAYAPPPTGNLPLRLVVVALVSATIGWLAAAKAGLGLVPGCVIGAAMFGIGIFSAMKLAGAPAGLWITFGLKFFSVTAYKLVTVVLVSFLMKDCGVQDAHAQLMFMLWGLFMSVSTVLSGALADALGLRRTLLFGVTLCLLTRLVMVSSGNAWVVMGCGLIPLAVGEALCTPVLVAATRKFTTPSQRSVAFSVFYAILNLGFMVGYFIYDGVQKSVPAGGDRMAFAGYEFSPRRVLLGISVGVELLALPFILLLGERARGSDSGAPVVRLNLREAARETGRLFLCLVRHPGFRRLLLFLVMIGILKMVFSIMDGVLPTFVERELGPEGKARTGRFNAVNSILILMLAPLVGMLTRKASAYSMVILGGFITALSFIFLALPASSFQGLANGWAGDWVVRGYLELKGDVSPYFLMIVLWQIGFSIGEAFYSPRVYEYAVSIAPKGQEASYASLSAVPLLMGKLATGAAFSWLLTRYCPAEGPRDSSTMWTIVGCMVLIAPLGLLLFKPFIRVKEEGRE